MENQSEQQPTEIKRYRFRFSPLILSVLILGVVLCLAGIGLTTWQLIDFLKEDHSSVYGWMTYFLMYFASVSLAVLLTAILIRSQYVVTKTHVILQFGLVKTKYEIKKIFSLKLFRGSNRLTVYFDDFKTNFAVIVVKDTWYDDFIKTLTERNPRIEFDFITAEEELQWKDNNKKK